jgi:hypothetical protein
MSSKNDYVEDPSSKPEDFVGFTEDNNYEGRREIKDARIGRMRFQGCSFWAALEIAEGYKQKNKRAHGLQIACLKLDVMDSMAERFQIMWGEPAQHYDFDFRMLMTQIDPYTGVDLQDFRNDDPDLLKY